MPWVAPTFFFLWKWPMTICTDFDENVGFLCWDCDFGFDPPLASRSYKLVGFLGKVSYKGSHSWISPASFQPITEIPLHQKTLNRNLNLKRLARFQSECFVLIQGQVSPVISTCVCHNKYTITHTININIVPNTKGIAPNTKQGSVWFWAKTSCRQYIYLDFCHNYLPGSLTKPLLLDFESNDLFEEERDFYRINDFWSITAGDFQSFLVCMYVKWCVFDENIKHFSRPYSWYVQFEEKVFESPSLQLREAIHNKKEDFLWTNFIKGLPDIIRPFLYQNPLFFAQKNRDFIKRGEGGSLFYKRNSQTNPFYIKDGFPYIGLLPNLNTIRNLTDRREIFPFLPKFIFFRKETTKCVIFMDDVLAKIWSLITIQNIAKIANAVQCHN